MQTRTKIGLGVLAVLIIAGGVLALPPVWSRVTPRVTALYADIKYALFPPEKAVFTPGQSTPDDVAQSVRATLTAMAPTLTPTATLAADEPSPTPTITPTPLPQTVLLKGVTPMPETWNNCGPATLSMALSFYKITAPQADIAAVVKPNKRDKNVMPYELVNYVNDQTQMRALSRIGGTLDTLRSLLSAGFPVIIEKGFEPANLTQGWMGHYNLILGYDDAKQQFTTQDSYLLINQKDWQKSPGFVIPYTDIEANWRAFDFLFIVVYPPEKENDVLNAMGSLMDESTANRAAYNRAVAETKSLSDLRDRFFAWHNVGSSSVALQDYIGAAAAYDAAYGIYPEIAEKQRPWRMIWYQTGPYYAYFYTGRYADVINLATTTLDAMSEPILEESYYWRAQAELAQGDQAAAVADLHKSLEVHAGFGPSLALLNQIGVAP
ncbi:MAG: C39 family peptidase [Anaerolineaceae bacterium]